MRAKLHLGSPEVLMYADDVYPALALSDRSVLVTGLRHLGGVVMAKHLLSPVWLGEM